jgi:outer membrane protein OmpA-like peptidoglycan-associated protein
VTGAIGVEVPLQTRLLLGLEAAYRYGLTTVRTDIDWRTNSLQGAITLRWRFLPEETKRDTAETPQSEKMLPTLAAAQLLIESIAGKPLEIQETVVTQTFPLLPYIFFDSASVVVKNRYNPRIGTTASFDEQSLPKETLAIYYHLLHIIGKRMRANPKTTLTITGTTDGKEWASADQRQILAQQRARSVAGFLMGYWGITQSRLKLTTRDTPKLASSDRYAEGNEENRRVELSSNDPELLAPVVQYRFLEYTPVRTEHYMTVKVQNPGAAESYKGSLNALEEPFAVTSGVDAPPTRLPFALRRKFTAKLSQTVGSLDSADCALEVKQRDGQTLSAHTRINVETLKNQFEVSRLNLIVFDFDRDDMVESNRVMMRGFVLDAIKPNSLVSVLGSTDRLGEAKYNKELSESRAKGVQDFMRRVNPNIRFQEVRGTGASSLPFDNDLPEGRYYCRTVSINVQTPRGG